MLTNHELYDVALEMLSKHSIAVIECRYDAMFAGCWFITVLAVPELRLVWDGRENWATIEERTSRVFQGMPVWQERWIQRSPNATTLDDAIEKLARFVGHQAV